MLDLPLVGYDEALEIVNRPEITAGMVRDGREDYPAELPRWDEAESYITPLGGWYFLPVNNTIHEAHVFYTKAARGGLALEHSRRVLQDMSRKTGKIIGQIAIENRLACRFAEKLGYRLVDLKTGDYWIGDKRTDLGLFVYEFEKVC